MRPGDEVNSITDDEIISILDRASKARIGLILWTNDFAVAKARLARLRKERVEFGAVQIRDGSAFGEGCLLLTRGEKKK